MSQVKQFQIQDIEQVWRNKYSKLQNQLLEARIEEINLKRINKNLQETLRTAVGQNDKEQQSNSMQRINLTWKQKYQFQLQRNLQNQNYIKVLEKKRNNLSIDKPNKKRQYSTNSNAKPNFNTQTKPRPSNLTYFSNQQNFNITTLSRKSSVKKMQNFMDRLLTQRYSITEFGKDNYTNYKKDIKKSKPIYCVQDPIERMFCSIKQIPKQNVYFDTQQNQMPLKARMSLNQNKQIHKFMTSKSIQNTLNKKLTLTSHIR